MPLYIIREDITRIATDAIVNPTDPTLSGGGGLDRQIHEKGGEVFMSAIGTARLGGELAVGEARATVAGALPCRFVIHTVGPRYVDGCSGERSFLLRAYRNAISCARSLGCESIALPLISTGTFAYPLRESFLAAREVAMEFVDQYELSISLVVYQKEALDISRTIVAYVEDRIGRDDPVERRRRDAKTESPICWPERECHEIISPSFRGMQYRTKSSHALQTYDAAQEAENSRIITSIYGERTLDEILDELDESFSEMLLRFIDERGMKDSECYKRANIDRKLFSKIRSDKYYRPSKPTVIAFALALSLTLDETKRLLTAAGFALSGSSKFDVIIEY